ncbi:MAG: DUF5320 domain-containing protein [Desulfobacteraceae bacterium]|nr:DUF5320 domain-containing protein [Desulfobacteraceae bacterium]
MPGFNRTGPMGDGPMTGGGRGYCGAGYTDTGRWNSVRFRHCRGVGYRSRRGYGAGLGWWAPPGSRVQMDQEYIHADEPSNEINRLKTQAHALHAKLEAITRRIEKYEKEAPHTGTTHTWTGEKDA